MSYDIPADQHNSGIAPSAPPAMKAEDVKIVRPMTAVDVIGAILNDLCRHIHGDNISAGWWHDLKTGEPLDRNFGELLCLVHSEISEAMEGHRKNLMDDKLPQYPMAAVELADAIIRICDIAGSRGWDLGTIIQAKREYNRNRADHKPENRLKEGGKTY